MWFAGLPTAVCGWMLEAVKQAGDNPPAFIGAGYNLARCKMNGDFVRGRRSHFFACGKCFDRDLSAPRFLHQAMVRAFVDRHVYSVVYNGLPREGFLCQAGVISRNGVAFFLRRIDLCGAFGILLQTFLDRFHPHLFDRL